MEPLENEVLESSNPKYTIDWKLYQRLKYLGIVHADEDNSIDIRSFNIGNSDYSKHTIQPWSIWLDYSNLTSWDHDIIKRVLRTKKGESRLMDYEKIIHDCNERIRQLNFEQREENDL